MEREERAQLERAKRSRLINNKARPVRRRSQSRGVSGNEAETEDENIFSSESMNQTLSRSRKQPFPPRERLSSDTTLSSRPSEPRDGPATSFPSHSLSRSLGQYQPNEKDYDEQPDLPGPEPFFNDDIPDPEDFTENEYLPGNDKDNLGI